MGTVALLTLMIGTALSTPLPKGKALVVTTEPPDTINEMDVMMGDAPAQTAGMKEPIIYALLVNSEIQLRYAQTLVTSKIRNPANASQETTFAVVLPESAFITGFVMETPKKTYRARLRERAETEAAYSTAVLSGKAGALLSYRHSNLFDVNVNLEPFQQVTFKLAYEEWLERESGLYRHIITVVPGQIVPGMKFIVHITEPRKITNIISPKFAIRNIGVAACSGANMNLTCIDDNEVVKKTRLSSSEVLVEYGLSIREQKRLAQGSGTGGLSGQFEVLYDVERDAPGGEILVKDGHFIHFFVPPSQVKNLPKHMIFVLDVSGSMDGRKIVQVKDAMLSILPTLSDDDLFNIIVFADYVKTWNFESAGNDLITEKGGSETSRYNDVLPGYSVSESSIQNANASVEAMIANGGTNIFGALRQAIRTAKNQQSRDPSRKPIIMFLTDGDPNVGISDPNVIISELAKLNTAPKVPIYSYAFGEDGKIEFLKNISLANSGVAQPIYEGPDASDQLNKVYEKISHAVLSNVTFKYLPEEVDLSSTTKLNYHTFFEGNELVVSGRTIDKNAKKIFAEVSALGEGLQNKKFLPQAVDAPVPKHKVNASAISLNDPNAPPTGFLERTWAYLTIKKNIEKARTGTTSPSEPDPMQRAIELAKKYSFATEVTSLVIVKPDGNEQVSPIQRIPAPPDQPDQPVAAPLTQTVDTAPEDNSTDLPTLSKSKAKNTNRKEFTLYDKLVVSDISWMPVDAHQKGYVDLLSSNGSFTRYVILYDAEPLNPEDEPLCEVAPFAGRCRHISQCVMREIVNDYPKFRRHYQCDLGDYLAICCLD